MIKYHDFPMKFIILFLWHQKEGWIREAVDELFSEYDADMDGLLKGDEATSCCKRVLRKFGLQ